MMLLTTQLVPRIYSKSSKSKANKENTCVYYQKSGTGGAEMSAATEGAGGQGGEGSGHTATHLGAGCPKA